ncbi:MAG: outer membrane protein assembly factor BamA [Spirochaetales bacterium]|jgi:outer membrane protein insertion porin family|nr:outer membrane protein assembly factor BamA [Spirochaetales bacterium]
MQKCSLFLCILLFPVLCVFAQDYGEWFVDKPIKDIVFNGLDTVSLNELNRIVDPYRNRKYTDSILNELQDKLYALDYFTEITVNAREGDPAYESVIIEFNVTERPVINEIQFNGNRRVRAGELLDAILVKRGDMIVPSRLQADEEAIRKLYLEKGYPDVRVTYSLEADRREGRQIVVFDITEGSQTSIRTIQFSGNTAFSQNSLRNIMESSEQGLFNSGAFNEQQLQADLLLIENYYKERGYVDARVLRVDRAGEKEGEDERVYLTLTIYLYEGTAYQYGGMSFEGNQLFTTEQLTELLRVSPEGPLNLTRVDQDYQRVVDLYYESGYIFNTIHREEVRNELARTISYKIRIIERGRAHIESLIIRGNEKTKNFVLEREITLEPGDVFSKTKILESIQNLYNLQYFSAVTPETPQGSADGLMDLIINVEESSTADIMFGLAFGGSADFPVSANVRWTDRNFLGNGQTFSVDVTLSPVQQTLSFNFLEKWLMGKRWSGGLDFVIRHSEFSGLPQDIIPPIFDGNKPGEDAFPDPFTGEYVYANDGRPWQGHNPPTSAEINQYNLVTDYEYAGGTTAAVGSGYKMSYTSYDFSVGGSTGYRFPTPFGVLGTSLGLRTMLTFIDYDEELHRPYLATDRENHRTWMFTNSLSTGLSLDKRDFYFNPKTGYYLSQVFRFVGGPLRGERHYFKTTSKIENFNTLINWEVTDDWSYQLVLGLHSELSFILPIFWAPAGYNRLTAGTYDLMLIDGMYIARGWSRELDKRVIWDNWIELRMPISERIVWFDLFFDMVGRWNTPDQFQEFTIQDFLFGLGAGFRFSIPQFPIRFYVAKRFLKDNILGAANWQRGSLFRDSAGLDFVFSIGYEIFNQ